MDVNAILDVLSHGNLAPSARVDLLHLLIAGKPAVRLKAGAATLGHLRLWSEENGFACASDDDNYCCLARSDALAHHVLEVDRRAEPHELELGTLLGYPGCCCEAIARIGENRIDERAALIAEWKFKQRFRLIDPSGYQRGASLICHLPCSPTCRKSLLIALRAARFLRPRLGQPEFAAWAEWVGQL